MLASTRCSGAVGLLSAPQAASGVAPVRPICQHAAALRRLRHSSRVTPISATPEAAEIAPGQGASPPPSMQGLGDTYAVIEIGGVQQIVEEGRFYTCNRIDAQPGSTIKLGRVLAHKAAGRLTAGRPYLTDVNVEAKILPELKGPKLIVYKHKPKKHYQRKTGHRQPLSKFLVTKISA